MPLIGSPMTPGQRYHNLVAVNLMRRTKTGAQVWRFQCDCGQQTIVPAAMVRSDNTKSCGCLRSIAVKKAHAANFKHGKSGTVEYRLWNAMIQRCHNEKNLNYPGWGRRGISVCARWLSFENFLSDVGVRPGPQFTLDRIDNDGNYEPGNVRWATKKEQANNRRNTIRIVIADNAMSLQNAALLAGLKYKTAYARYRNGTFP